MRMSLPIATRLTLLPTVVLALLVAGLPHTVLAQSGPLAAADTTLEGAAPAPPARTPATAESFRETVRNAQQFQDTRREGLADRWRLLDPNGLPVAGAGGLNPYAQNRLKGDFPMFGQNTFGVLTILENPTSNFSNQENSETALNNTLLGAFEIFNGLTVFRPKSFALKGALRHVSNDAGAERVSDVGLVDGFAELKLADLGQDFYDFASVRAGIQAFKSDFEGLVFNDFNLGAQLFGELKSNRYRFALAFFSPRAKNLAGLDLDLLDQSLNQQVGIGTLIIEDFLRPGFNGALSVHFNTDTSIEGRDLSVLYVGFASAGNIGRFAFKPAFYLVTGTEDLNPVAGQDVSISAFLAGAEFEYPTNWLTYRAGAFMASGDSDPTDDTAGGFDSINDGINLFGGANSFVIGGGAAFGTRPNSFIPSLRAIPNRSNFINPGMLVANAGLDAVVTPKMLLQLDFNFFQFNQDVFLGGASTALGQELAAALKYRLFLNENLVLQAGGSFFMPGEAGKLILGSESNVMSGNVKLVALF